MWTVAQLAADLDKGRTTSRELVEQALARIADPAGEGKRAFLEVYTERARAEADYCDRLRKGGVRRSRIDGLPVSLKDLYDVAGEVTRAGSKVLAKAPPAKADAAAVARLRASGPPHRRPVWRAALSRGRASRRASPRRLCRKDP